MGHILTQCVQLLAEPIWDILAHIVHKCRLDLNWEYWHAKCTTVDWTKMGQIGTQSLQLLAGPKWVILAHEVSNCWLYTNGENWHTQ